MPDDSFQKVLTDAINAISEDGFVSDAQIYEWMARLRNAADREMPSDAETRRKLRESLNAIYARLIEKGRIIERVPGVPRYTLQMVHGSLRAELDRRVRMSADLIRLNREAAIDTTLRRFAGWTTSVPTGGSNVIEKRKVKQQIGKSLQQTRFEMRRVAIDQGHKLNASISEIVALGNNAIAAVWRHVHQAHYDGRPEHEARDGKVFMIRDSWASQAGLIKPANGYTDQIDMVAEKPFCRCWYRYVMNIGDLPAEMITEKGRRWLAEARAAA